MAAVDGGEESDFDAESVEHSLSPNVIAKVDKVSEPTATVATVVQLNEASYFSTLTKRRSKSVPPCKRSLNVSNEVNNSLKDSSWKYRLRQNSGKYRYGEKDKQSVKVLVNRKTTVGNNSPKKGPIQTPKTPKKCKQGTNDGIRSVREFLVFSVHKSSKPRSKEEKDNNKILENTDNEVNKEVAEIQDLNVVSKTLRRLSDSLSVGLDNNENNDTAVKTKAQETKIASNNRTQSVNMNNKDFQSDISLQSQGEKITQLRNINSTIYKEAAENIFISDSETVSMAGNNRDIDETPTPSAEETQPTALELLEKEVDTLSKELTQCETNSMDHMMKMFRLDMKRDSLRLMREMQKVNCKSSQLETEIETLKTEKKLLEQKVNSIDTAHTTTKEDISKNSKSMEEVREELRLLRGVISKHTQQLTLLGNKNEEKEFFSMRNNLMIQGIEEDDDETNENVKQLVTDFFSQSMKIKRKISILSAKRIGNQLPRVIQVTLENVKDKGVIYKHSKNLKYLRNNNDDPYFINDHLPLGMQEEQRKKRGIIKNDKTLPDNDRADFTWKKGELFINNKQYRDPVVPPTIEQVITPMEGGEEVVINKGETQKNEGCRFTGYSAEIKTIHDVKKAYIKVRKNHPEALSIMCAYRIPGTDHSRLQNYQDDGEAGGGRVLFQLLLTSDIMHRAIYVVRHFGNKHLGPSRFESIQAAARSAIMRTTMNTILGKNQFLKSIDKGSKTRSLRIIKGLRGGRGSISGASRGGGAPSPLTRDITNDTSNEWPALNQSTGLQGAWSNQESSPSNGWS